MTSTPNNEIYYFTSIIWCERKEASKGNELFRTINSKCNINYDTMSYLIYEILHDCYLIYYEQVEKLGSWDYRGDTRKSGFVILQTLGTRCRRVCNLPFKHFSSEYQCTCLKRSGKMNFNSLLTKLILFLATLRKFKCDLKRFS